MKSKWRRNEIREDEGERLEKNIRENSWVIFKLKWSSKKELAYKRILPPHSKCNFQCWTKDVHSGI
jgi:hypothetical protein